MEWINWLTICVELPGFVLMSWTFLLAENRKEEVTPLMTSDWFPWKSISHQSNEKECNYLIRKVKLLSEFRLRSLICQNKLALSLHFKDISHMCLFLFNNKFNCFLFHMNMQDFITSSEVVILSGTSNEGQFLPFSSSINMAGSQAPFVLMALFPHFIAATRISNKKWLVSSVIFGFMVQKNYGGFCTIKCLLYFWNFCWETTIDLVLMSDLNLLQLFNFLYISISWWEGFGSSQILCSYLMRQSRVRYDTKNLAWTPTCENAILGCWLTHGHTQTQGTDITQERKL